MDLSAHYDSVNIWHMCCACLHLYHITGKLWFVNTLQSCTSWIPNTPFIKKSKNKKGDLLVTVIIEIPTTLMKKQKQLLAELLDKNQLYINLSEIEDADFGVSAEDKALNKAFYGE